MSQQYKKAIIRCTCLFLAGAALQFILGATDPTLLAYPWGMITAINYLYLLTLISFNRERWKWTEWFFCRNTYISSLTAMLILTLLFGLIRQDGTGTGISGALGFTQMKNSWIFNIFLFEFMTILGARSIYEIRKIKRQYIPKTIIHVSFFVILASAFFGSGDKSKITVTAVQGDPTNRGTTKSGQVVQLPFTLRLKKFSMEEYSPKIHLLSGSSLTKEYITIDTTGVKGRIEKWEIECTKYSGMAGIMPGDSVYIPINHVGATTAAYIKATDGERSAEGWISCGSHIFPGKALTLPDGTALVMPQREAKKYLSIMEISEGEEKKEVEISVNNPATIGTWKIYQSAYDHTRGKWSTITILECVKDSYYPIIRIAMWLAMIVGAVMFFRGNRTNNKEEEKR